MAKGKLANRDDLTYAVGDCHGCFDQLSKLVSLCIADAGTSSKRFVFLGDYIDRGPQSRHVIDYLILLQSDPTFDVICLMGNHEDLALAAVRDRRNEERWVRNGGDATLLSYGVREAASLPKDHVEWMDSLPTYYDDGLRFFVHAGVHPDRPLDEQDEHDFLWIREPFLSSQRSFGRLVVHGHTPIPNGLPDLRDNRLNMDTGAVFGRPLTAAVFSNDVAAPIRFLCS